MTGLAFALLAVVPAEAEVATPAVSPAPDAVAMRDRGVRFLTAAQLDDGSWNERESVGATALAVTALMRSGVPAESDAVSRGLAYLLQNRRDDGGIYGEGSIHRNYDTCLAMLALTAAGRTDLEDQIAFLKQLQWDQTEGIGLDNTAFGGAGYGSHERPDLSNTQFFIDALHEAGLPEDDPAMQKALVFLSRAQNLDTPFNQTPLAPLVDDGGFLYTPAGEGESKAGRSATGGLRSYGSMTYAGLKSLIYAGLDKSDVRVRAATDWLRSRYTMDENPGLDQQGLFYYYHTLAKTMAALGQDRFVTADDVSHDWRADLVAALAERQQGDGSWINPADRWMEGDPRLVTSYALLALSYAMPVDETPADETPADETPAATE